MPCYVIARTRFRRMTEFHSFRRSLQALADGAQLKLLPLDASTTAPDDQSVMMEFDSAARASAFMVSDGYRRIATPGPERPGS